MAAGFPWPALFLELGWGGGQEGGNGEWAEVPPYAAVQGEVPILSHWVAASLVNWLVAGSLWGRCPKLAIPWAVGASPLETPVEVFLHTLPYMEIWLQGNLFS